MCRHSRWWTRRAKDRGRTDPGMFEEGESSCLQCRVLGAGEATKEGPDAGTFLFVQRAQYLPKFFIPEHKVSDSPGPVQSLTIQSHSGSLCKCQEEPPAECRKSPSTSQSHGIAAVITEYLLQMESSCWVCWPDLFLLT